MENAPFGVAGLKFGSEGRRILKRYPIPVGAAHWAAWGFQVLHTFLRPCRGGPCGRRWEYGLRSKRAPSSAPFGGTFPLEGGRLGGRQWGRPCKRVQTLPPHPVQCAHWTTFPPRGRFMVRCMKGVQNLLPFPSGEDYVAPEALARQLRRSPKTATATNFAYPWPQWARKETQASTPDFARRK